MSVTVLVTNLTDDVVSLDDIYTELGASGASNDHVSFVRSAGQIDDMANLKALLHAGTVSVSVTQSSDNSDILSIPLEQHATVGNLAVDATAVITSVVTFNKPFPSTPTIMVSMRRGTHTDWKGQVYVQAASATGFTIALDVTTGSGTVSEKGSVSWIAIL